MSEIGKYFGAWSNWEEMARELVGTIWNEATKAYDMATPDEDFPTDAEVVVAGYETESYSGSSTIIFERGGKLFEDSSSHCSCNGLEWGGGSEISWDYIEQRLKDGYFYGLCGEGIEVLRAAQAKRRAANAETLKALGADAPQDYSLLDPISAKA